MHSTCARSKCFSRLLFVYLLLYQTCAENGTLTCSFAKIYEKEPIRIDISNLEKKNDLKSVCIMASKISLEGESTLTVDGVDNVPAFVDWIFITRELEMCVSLENTESLRQVLIDTYSVVGRCEGPIINIVNNINLYTIEVRNDKFGKNLSSIPNAIRVRGNRKLDIRDLKDLEKLRKTVNANWDLQPAGECALPKPFISFETLDQNCTNFYGPLTLRQGITEFQYDLSKVHKFDIEGCIQIERTELKDIAFLNAFSRFRRMQSCSQFIRDNKKLCSRNLKYLNVFFKDIQFSNNTDQPCGECIGGQVSEHYLRESVNCSIVYGDLVIENFRGLPSNIENLRGIEAIEGRLIVMNNTGLNKFDYLASLKKVGRTNRGVAIIVKNNGDLSLLKLPNLLGNQLEKEERAEFVNNPMLRGELEQSTTSYVDTTKGYTSVKEHEESPTAFENSRMLGSTTSAETSPHADDIHNKKILGVTGAVAGLAFLCGLVILIVYHRKTSTVRLPKSPYELYTPTKEKISSCTNTKRNVLRSASVSSGSHRSSITAHTSSRSSEKNTASFTVTT